jgi:hypothetical protein
VIRKKYQCSRTGAGTRESCDMEVCVAPSQTILGWWRGADAKAPDTMSMLATQRAAPVLVVDDDRAFAETLAAGVPARNSAQFTSRAFSRSRNEIPVRESEWVGSR